MRRMISDWDGDRIDTLAEWKAHAARMCEVREDWFTEYPLYGMRRSRDGVYQFGYEIVGNGTIVGHCSHHVHKSRSAAEDCGRRFLAGQPPRWWWRLHRAITAVTG